MGLLHPYGPYPAIHLLNVLKKRITGWPSNADQQGITSQLGHYFVDDSIIIHFSPSLNNKMEDTFKLPQNSFGIFSGAVHTTGVLRQGTCAITSG